MNVMPHGFHNRGLITTADYLHQLLVGAWQLFEVAESLVIGNRIAT
jgi:hypothetical protein